MFKALEARANVLCAGILVGTVVVGKIFGGALKGLVPLAMCLASAVYLWMKEVIRSGREVEWDSEQVRGQMVNPFGNDFCSTFTNHRPSRPR